MEVAFRQIRTRGVFLDQRAFRREVEQTIDRKSKPELIKAHERVTANWKTDIDFKAMKRITRKGITVFVFAAGPNKDIWIYVTGGTRPHIIKPRGSGYPLRFKTGYKPKTAPVGKFGGPGVSTGPQVRAYRVRHPGTKARNFEKTIAADYKKTFQRDIENAMRRGLRRARGEMSSIDPRRNNCLLPAAWRPPGCPVTSENLEWVQFAINPTITGHSEGRVYWNPIEGTINIETDITDVTLQVGQEQYVRAYNNSGGPIANGELVYITGADGGGLPTIDLAMADDLLTSVVAGMATADIANGTVGIVTTFGLVRDIDTSGCVPGDTVYLSATVPGAFENTIPDSPNLVVKLGTCLTSNIATGQVLIQIEQADIISGVVQSKVYTLPLRGVAAATLNITGDLRTVAAGQVGDYAVDFAVINNHIFLLVNALTGSGDVTITGTSVDETDGTPTVGDTETITVDTAAGQYYQSSKKWWEVTNIDIPAGITVIDYDIGVVGYSDFGNTNFKVTGYRIDATSQGINSEIRFRIIKIDDDGSGKMSISDLEDITIDSGVAGDQIIDNLRAGADDRSFNPAVAAIWPDTTVAVLKQGDFDTYFSSDENVFESRTKDEGFILRIEQSNNVDFITLRLDYQIITG